MATDRASDAAAGDSLLPQGRHRVDPRRLRRLHRQGADGRGVQQGADAQDGPDARAHATCRALLKHIENGDIDPSFVVTHTVPLDEAPEMYKTFRDKKDGCIKVVLKPH